jgi:hypothetical protein
MQPSQKRGAGDPEAAGTEALLHRKVGVCRRAGVARRGGPLGERASTPTTLIGRPTACGSWGPEE